MTEDGDFYREVKAKSKEKRNQNLENARKILSEYPPIIWVEKDNGHFIINNGAFDFWATTGLFIERKTGKRGRGIKDLINRITSLRSYNLRDFITK